MYDHPPPLRLPRDYQHRPARPRPSCFFLFEKHGLRDGPAVGRLRQNPWTRHKEAKPRNPRRSRDVQPRASMIEEKLHTRPKSGLFLCPPPRLKVSRTGQRSGVRDSAGPLWTVPLRVRGRLRFVYPFLRGSCAPTVAVGRHPPLWRAPRQLQSTRLQSANRRERLVRRRIVWQDRRAKFGNDRSILQWCIRSVPLSGPKTHLASDRYPAPSWVTIVILCRPRVNKAPDS